MQQGQFHIADTRDSKPPEDFFGNFAFSKLLGHNGSGLNEHNEMQGAGLAYGAYRCFSQAGEKPALVRALTI